MTTDDADLSRRQVLDDLEALPRVRSLSRWDRMWRPFWVLPTFICLLAVAAGLLVPVLDRHLVHAMPYIFGGGAESARSLLGTIAGAMISVTGLVFSVTLVALQLANSQFTPRVLQEFLDSRVVQVTLGIFAASFIYALTVLRAVQGDLEDSREFVPQAAISVAFLLVLASVAMFLAFIHHITNAIQVTSMISDIGDETVEVARRYFSPVTSTSSPLRWEPRHDIPALEVRSLKRHGSLAQVRHRTLAELAAEHDVVIEVVPSVGTFVPDGAPLARVWGEVGSEADAEQLHSTVGRCLDLTRDRATHQDPAFGVRKLVDIAERALSIGFNDPTTATQVLDELHRILRQVVDRFDPPSVVTIDGEVRLVHQPQSVAQLIDLSLEEVLHYGTNSLQVPRRVLQIVDDLLEVTRPEHVERLQHWRAVALERLAAVQNRPD